MHIRISLFLIIMLSSKTGLEDLGLGEQKMLIPWGIHMLRICLPVHKGFGLMITGVGTVPSQSGTQSKIFWKWSQSKNVSCKVYLAQYPWCAYWPGAKWSKVYGLLKPLPNRDTFMKCTWQGTHATWLSSARVSSLWGTLIANIKECNKPT